MTDLRLPLFFGSQKPIFDPPADMIFIFIPLAFITLYLWRRLFHARLMQFESPHRVLLVATNPVERGIEAELRDRPLGDYSVVGEFYVTGTASDDGRQIVDAQNRRLDEAVREEGADTLVFSARGGFPPEYLEQAIDWKRDQRGDYHDFHGRLVPACLSIPDLFCTFWSKRNAKEILCGRVQIILSFLHSQDH